MKKAAIVLCLLCFAGCTFASEAYQVPGSYKETVTQTVSNQSENTEATASTKTKKRFFKKRYKDYNPQNSYWNFGRPTFWTGTI